MQRRTLFKLGLGAAALLAVGGAGIAVFSGPGLSGGRLTDAGREVFTGVARGVLDGCMPTEPSRQAAALQAHLVRLDETLAAFPLTVQAEISQLLSLLAAAPTRVLFAGLQRSWSESTVPELQAALQSMRLSSLALRQQGYHALRDLTNAAYFSDPSTWTALGYPGPRTI